PLPPASDNQGSPPERGISCVRLCVHTCLASGFDKTCPTSISYRVQPAPRHGHGDSPSSLHDSRLCVFSSLTYPGMSILPKQAPTSCFVARVGGEGGNGVPEI